MTLAIIFLILLGLFLLFLELFIVPGVTFVGIFGFLFLAAGIYYIYSIFGMNIGNISLGVLVLITVLGIFISFKKGAWNKFALKEEIQGKVNVLDESLFEIGDIGLTLSDLRPMGTAQINEQNIEVQSVSDFIDTGNKIKIIKIDGNKVWVEQA